MSGFSIDWLDLRENADHLARSSTLLAQAMRWLAAHPSPQGKPLVVDLGAGTGSTLRAFAASGADASSVSWQLVDHDRELLDEAQRRHGAGHHIKCCPADLTSITALPLQDATLVTASALFDLVSVDFIEALASRLQPRNQAQPLGVYAALNYDGLTRWTPVHPLDDTVLDAFNRDQRRDKGFGPALGPDAGDCMQRVFTQAGFTVHSASSPWELDGNDQELVSALIEGIAGAVAQDPRLDAATLRDWVGFRRKHVANGTCIVGHTDLLALPESAGK